MRLRYVCTFCFIFIVVFSGLCQCTSYSQSLEKFWIDQGNSQLSKGIQDASREQCEKAAKSYQLAININPVSIDPWIAKGQLFQTLGRYNESIECYDNALKINSSHTGALSAKAISLLDSADLVNALECINKTIESNEHFASAWVTKGKILWTLGRHNESIYCSNKALEIEPQLAIAYENKGSSYFELGKYNEAIECYDKAIDIDSEFASTWLLKGLALYKVNEYSKALECYNRSLEIDPTFIPAQYAYYLMVDAIKKSEILYIKTALSGPITSSPPYSGGSQNEPPGSASSPPGVCWCNTTKKFELCEKDELPCIPGFNYCGPKCSGDGFTKGVTGATDECCKQHDICYGKYGYFDCSCDEKIVECLSPNRNFRTKDGMWAWAMYIWFKYSPCTTHETSPPYSGGPQNAPPGSASSPPVVM